MKQNKNNRFAALLLALCMAVCCALPALAAPAASANIDLSRTGSMDVTLYDHQNDVPLRGGALTVYKVADVARTNGDLHFVYTADFTGCGIALGDLTDLKESGMDYWALGHVHNHQIVCEKPYVVYAGNPQGLDCTETGPRGCYYVEVGPYGTANLEFIDTSIVRWETTDVDIAPFESVSELRDAVRFTKEKIRKDIGKPTFLTIQFTGAGSMYQVLNNPEATQYWIDAWREEEAGKYAFVMVQRLRNLARPKINAGERSKLPDTVGDYLNVFDKLESLPRDEKVKALREVLAQRPEFERLGAYGRSISDDRLLEAFEKAKWLGMQKLLEDKRG